jgi:hypothetical protein
MDTFATAHIGADDDLRHRVPDGVKTRDSLFWNLVLPNEQVAVQVYLWTDGRGVAGRQVAVYQPDRERNLIASSYNVDLGPDSDLDDWECDGLRVRQPEPLRVAEIGFDRDGVTLDYRFTARHRPFSYRENPAGCPPWMATNRFEQSGRASGELRLGQPGTGDRVIPFVGVWAHRDHSWGRRNWNWVHHWKWVIAGVPSGTELNAMFHVARGEFGVNGYVLRGTEPVPLVAGHATASYDPDMSQSRLEAELTDARGGTTHLVMERFAIFHLPFGSDSLLSEAACRVTIDGEPGTGQFETLWPRGYIQRLVAAE